MASIYYKTEKNSETGKKFQALLNRANEIREQIVDFCKRYGGTGNYVYSTAYALKTDITAIEIKDFPDQKKWKKDKDFKWCYSPKRNSKKGNEIHEEMKAIPAIELEELNAIIGYEDGFLNTIGYHIGKIFFGFSVGAEWEVNVPHDCEEITYSEYKEL